MVNKPWQLIKVNNIMYPKDFSNYLLDTDMKEQVKQVIALALYRKHLSHRTLGRLEPADSLKYKPAA